MTIPSGKVKWSDIYNAITGGTHNGSTSINKGAYIGHVWADGTAVPSKNISIGTHFRGKSMPASGPDYPDDIEDIAPFQVIALDSRNHGKNFKYDPGKDFPFYFTDSGTDREDYKGDENFYITCWSPKGLRFWVNSSTGANYFQFEKGYSYSQYDRLGFQVSNSGERELINFQQDKDSVISEPWLQTSLEQNPPWSKSFGGSKYNSSASVNGYIFPADTRRAEELGNQADRAMDVNYTCIRFYFSCDGYTNERGWYFSVYPLPAK
jgi:hypothetical protein